MNRRRFLARAAVGAAAGATAGCLSRLDGVLSGGDADGEVVTVADGDGGGDLRLRVEPVAEGLRVPWGAAVRGRDVLLTERRGRVLRLREGTGPPETVLDEGAFPDLVPGGGLRGLAVHPDEPFAFTYGTYADGNRLVRHDLAAGWRAEPLRAGIPAGGGRDGGRLAVVGDALFVGTGDAGRGGLAGRPDSLAGKVLRLTLAGDSHPDNPGGTAVFTLGHRDVRGLAARDGTVYATERGPGRDDEVNRLHAGRNYGWPVVTGASGGFESPLASYTPPVEPGGATVYPDDGAIRAWRGSLLFGTLAGEHLRRVAFDGSGVRVDEALFAGRYGRLRTAFLGPDGHLHVATSNRDGRGRPRSGDDRVLRIRPV